MFSFIAIPLGYVMEFIYNFCQNYGAALIIFTVIIKVVMFPLAIKQQKSTAKMSAYQPMINEISKKYAKDKVKQQEEMVRLQQEYGFSPTAGCLPMGLNFLLLFGIIDVVYKPLTYILHVSNDAVLALQTAANIATTEGFRVESAIISAVQTHPHIFNADILDKIRSFNFMFCGIDLSQIPTVGFNILVIIPVLSVITMILSQIVMTKASGQEMQGSMKYMPWIMSLMFVYFGFTVPVAFSLYYTISNVLMIVQSLITKKMYDPQKMKEQIAAEMEAKRAEKKSKKTVTVRDDTGAEQKKQVNEAQLAGIRLQLARELDAARYADERTVPLEKEAPAPEAAPVSEDVAESAPQEEPSFADVELANEQEAKTDEE
ncbi:MAG: YidC/Oxa1 family membrane protein insertase [Pygmaiobacter sp.]